MGHLLATARMTARHALTWSIEDGWEPADWSDVHQLPEYIADRLMGELRARIAPDATADEIRQIIAKFDAR
jgi:hypothetical protein